MSEQKATVGVAQSATDAMCEAAVKADLVDRIQGFTYKTHHVIRDVFKDFSEQKIWEINKDDAGAEDKFYHQCRIERMRAVLNAALAAQPPAAPVECNLPFERLPQHASDPGFGPVPPAAPVEWDDVRGIAPDATGDLSSEAFVRKMRDEEWREPAAPVETVESLREALLDPNVVHINMLRGGIAKPSWAQIIHLYPEQFPAFEKVECEYCKETHDPRVACPAYVEQNARPDQGSMHELVREQTYSSVETCRECGVSDPCGEDCPNYIEPKTACRSSAETSEVCDRVLGLIADLQGEHEVMVGPFDPTKWKIDVSVADLQALVALAMNGEPQEAPERGEAE